MKHIRGITRTPAPAQTSLINGNLSPIETLILLLITVFFRDWDNYPQVIQNLQKYYAKTP
jgi:hypothetical protein